MTTSTTQSGGARRPAGRLPPWLRRGRRMDEDFADVQALLREFDLHTVCAEADCPNRAECWNRGTATFLILGRRCTRNCRFCNVEAGPPDEPRRVAEAAARMRLRHVVITSVTRDDLPDGGAVEFAETIAAVRTRLPDAAVEVLIPDFGGNPEALRRVLRARPDVLNHNLETVRRLQPLIRPRASYERSLQVLAAAAAADGPRVKSGLMLGLGETDAEVMRALGDLAEVGVRILTVGQYLAPSPRHWQIQRFVTPEEFDRVARAAREMGFDAVAAGPLVRSSYRADAAFGEARARGGGEPT